METIKGELYDLFSEETKLAFENVERLRNENAIKFDLDIATRFVHQKVLEHGWTKEFFKRFDSNYSFDAHGRTNKKRVERIGKKYQWIALYELLARLSDSFNSAIIPKKNRHELTVILSKKHLESPDTFAPSSFTSEIFYGEFH